MIQHEQLLANIERRGMWSRFQKDWLLEIRKLIRPQLPQDFFVLVELEVFEQEETGELISRYSLLIRRTPEERLIAALEILSPNNKGVDGPREMERYLEKRQRFLAEGVNLVEVDALQDGQKLLPPELQSFHAYPRTAWSVFRDDGKRRLSGWGWNNEDPIPKVTWMIEPGRRVIIDLSSALTHACEFNPWERLSAGS